MEFEPTEYVRKTFFVKAIEVSYKNIDDVATWCKGRVDTETTKVLGNEVTLPVIKFPGQGEDRGKELVARLGYFVVYSKGRYRVYKAPQFHAAFEKQVDANGKEVIVETTIEQVAGQKYEPEIDDEHFEVTKGEHPLQGSVSVSP